MTPQQREYCKAKAGQTYVLDYILGRNFPTVKWFRRQLGFNVIPDCVLADALLRRDEEQQKIQQEHSDG